MTLVDEPLAVEFDGAAKAPGAAKAAKHIAPFDGLRGLAILLVVIPHIAGAKTAQASQALIHATGTSGHGVDIFFVLSGFGLAYPLLMQRATGKVARLDLLTYAFNRLYRILPPFYVAIAFAYAAFVLARVFGRFPDPRVLFPPHTLYATLAPLVLFDRLNFPINPGLWTIAVQMRWYLLFPLMLLLWMKSPRAFGTLLGAVWLAFLFTRARSIDLGTLPLFMLGIVAAEMIVRRHRLLRYAILLLPIAILLALAWDPHAMVPDPWGTEAHFLGQPTSFAWHIVAFALVLTVASVERARALFAWRPLAALGTASFSIYLVHQPVIEFVLAVFGPRADLLAFGASIAAGALFWWCVERPLIDPVRRRRLRERASPAFARVFAWLGLPADALLAPAQPR